METLEVTRIDSAASLEALNRSEIDIQISTAKRYPRVIEDSLQRIVALATVNPQTAGECFYSLRRNGAEGGAAIEGPSVRLAEIVAASWGNLRVASQIIGNDGKFITARGVCHDLETNVAVASEVRRRITDRNGRTYNDDMQVVTGNAAGAIAFRNAVFKVVPKAVIADAIGKIKSALVADTKNDFEEVKAKMFSVFAKKGVTKDMILSYFEIEKDEDVTPEIVAELRTTYTAIKEGQATAEEMFIKPYNAKKDAEKAESKAGKGGSTAERLKKAMAAQEGLKVASEAEAEAETDDLPFE
jgi:hypothetical protein